MTRARRLELQKRYLLLLIKKIDTLLIREYQKPPYKYERK